MVSVCVRVGGSGVRTSLVYVFLIVVLLCLIDLVLCVVLFVLTGE